MHHRPVEFDEASHRRPVRPILNKIWTCVFLVLLVAALVTLYNRLQAAGLEYSADSGSRPQLDLSGYLCAPNGARPEVALERGCDWDPISFHWYPRERVQDPDNQELIRGFLEAGPWHRFYDSKGTVEVDPANRVLTTLWLTKREHVVHCMYTLRQTHLWLNKGFDPPFNYSHTIHCTSYLVNIILKSPVPDMDELTVHAVPYPPDWQVVSSLLKSWISLEFIKGYVS
ncbi:uncharacterized protein LY79DRAFT_527654 [Colletotrichum navitas]|uniref:Uncharacterized protein n=1 Tax=Colletotrichum navitas TaxID=681940 RepID=A0AAD8UZK2_9PEZI|nr:uncharacterized protein LY79DRAFT_527654 [Colletotrichum navitas]KAK1570018.1 hypothetical protein LY79DRAFT_527654 [Colletotrichum navitas]